MNIFRMMGSLLMLLISLAASAQIGLPEQLNKAIQQNDVVAVRDLIRSGAPVKTLDSYGYAPLVTAVLISANHDDSTTPLEIMRALLDAGADIEQQGPIGSSPPQPALAQQLRQRGATE